MELVEFLWARLDEQQRNGNWLGADLDGTPTRRQTGVDLIRDALAKRRIVDMHEPVTLHRMVDGQVQDVQACRYDTDPDGAGWTDYPCETLRVLAAVYADHPDYDEAWRPQSTNAV